MSSSLGFLIINTFLCIANRTAMPSTTNSKIRKTVKRIPKPMQWCDSLSLNHEAIDEQHQHLFALTNELIKHSDADVHSEIINETLYKLLQYIDHHFKDEEQLLEDLGYPKLLEHKTLHREFTRKIAMFCKDVVQGKAHIAEELIIYLTSWLKQHTSIDDQDYKNYL